jgi:hypothetical protein
MLLLNMIDFFIFIYNFIQFIQKINYDLLAELNKIMLIDLTDSFYCYYIKNYFK